jgi:hypothetical protein
MYPTWLPTLKKSGSLVPLERAGEVHEGATVGFLRLILFHCLSSVLSDTCTVLRIKEQAESILFSHC